ncbi:DUF3744 domain-containing protein, partial [Enterococcus faecalis]|uniref:DUF3744 domain-containing protein n=1 Tax=Enterococcus faecalis TaxID=1351 RepID=UPI0039A5584B
GLLKPSKGTIKIAEKNQEGKKLSIGYIPQQVASFNAGFPSTVIELVRSGRYPRGRWFKRLSEKDHQHVQRALEAVGMWDMRNRRIGELSGGQKQRVAMAGVLIDETPILLFDEPLANLDPQTGYEAIQMIDRLYQSQQFTTIIIEHRLEEVLAAPVDRVILIDEGKIIADIAPTELLKSDLLSKCGIREPLYITALKR